MSEGPNIKGNPLRIAVGLLVISYLIGEFILPKYYLLYVFKLLGVLGLILSTTIFFAGFSIFKSYDENPVPTSTTNRIIKTGIYAYTRNPIYLSFVLFFLSMFLVFENVMYFLSSIGLSVWIHHWVIKKEEDYLHLRFNDDYDQSMKFSPRDLVLVGGRRGAGKTLTCVNIASNVYNQGRSSIYFTIEMDSRSILQRMCALGARVPVGRLSTRNLTDVEWNRVAEWWATRFEDGQEDLPSHLPAKISPRLT